MQSFFFFQFHLISGQRDPKSGENCSWSSNAGRCWKFFYSFEAPGGFGPQLLFQKVLLPPLLSLFYRINNTFTGFRPLYPAHGLHYHQNESQLVFIRQQRGEHQHLHRFNNTQWILSKQKVKDERAYSAHSIRRSCSALRRLTAKRLTLWPLKA